MDDHVSINKPFDFRQYTQAVNRRKWLILTLILVAVATTFLINKRQLPVYETSMTIALNGPAVEAFKLPTALNQTIGSDAILTDVIADTDLDDTVVGLRSRVHAEIMNDTGLILISVRNSRRDRTKLIADAIGTRFMDVVKKLDVSQKDVGNKRKQVEVRLAEVEQEIETTKADLARVRKADIGDEMAKASYVNSLRGSLLSLKNSRYSLALEVPEDPPKSQIIAQPVKPGAPLPTNPTRNLMLSAASALLFGVSVSIVLQPRNIEDTPPLV